MSGSNLLFTDWLDGYWQDEGGLLNLTRGYEVLCERVFDKKNPLEIWEAGRNSKMIFSISSPAVFLNPNTSFFESVKL